jgi:hypothetical protein
LPPDAHSSSDKRPQGSIAEDRAESARQTRVGSFVSEASPRQQEERRLAKGLHSSTRQESERVPNSILLPLWQFDATTEDKMVPGLTRALHALKRNSFSAAHWFANPNPQLGNRTPIALLRTGNVDEVVAEAELADLIS